MVCFLIHLKSRKKKSTIVDVVKSTPPLCVVGLENLKSSQVVIPIKLVSSIFLA